MKKKTAGSPSQHFNTLGNWSDRSTKIILKSQQQSLRPSIPLRQWLVLQSSQRPSLPLSRNEADQPIASTNKPKRIEPFACSLTWLLLAHPGYLFAQFYYKTPVFLFKSSYQVKRFFINNKSIKQLPSSFDFPSSVHYWVKRFFHWRLSFGFFPQLSYGARRFFGSINLLVFLLFLPPG